MNDTELITLWKSYDKKLDESLALNRKNAEAITGFRVQSSLASMKPVKLFALLVGVLWVGFVDCLLINLYSIGSPFFLISAGIQVLLTKLAIGIYVYQLVLIHRVDASGPIVATQQTIARLQSSTIWVARLLFLQLPLWTTFYWNKGMLETGTNFLFLLQAIVTGSFTVLALWLFWHINYENRNKKWFRLIFDGDEWKPMLKAMDLLSQIDDYKQETIGRSNRL